MTVLENLEKVREKIDLLQSKNELHQKITILAVTKTHPASAVQDAIKAGLTDIGENRVQEAEKKFAECEGLSFTRHLIGPLQANKVNKATALFDWIQSIEKHKTAEKLNRKRKELNQPINVLIEINLSGESSKFGIQPEEVEELTGQIAELEMLKLRGYMTIGPLTSDRKRIAQSFHNLFSIREQMRTIYPSLNLDTLSMGMSGDYDLAVLEGANMLRLGSVLFGNRHYS